MDYLGRPKYQIEQYRTEQKKTIFEALNNIVKGDFKSDDKVTMDYFKKLSSEKTVSIYDPCFFLVFVLIQKKDMISGMVAPA